MIPPPSQIGSANLSQWMANTASLFFPLLKAYVNVNIKYLGPVFLERETEVKIHGISKR